MNKHSNLVVRLDQVNPDTQAWKDFLAMNMIYFKENWPNQFNNKSVSEFESEYDLSLQKKILDGNRGLFFAIFKEERCGFVNFYIDKFGRGLETDERTLFIAEFYISNEYRKKGLGTLLLNEVRSEGSKASVSILAAEVDKDQEGANAFWSKMNLNLDSSGTRNLYWERLE